MKGRFILIIVILIFHNNRSFSQDAIATEKTILRFHYLVPGFTLEQKLADSFSLSYEIGTGVQFSYQNINGESSSELAFSPYLRFEPRYYFDLSNRRTEGKRTEFLSSDYFSLQFKKGIPTANLESWYSYGMIIGFQRAFMKVAYFDFGIGIGATTMGYDTSVGFIGNFHLGILLTKNK